jgi:hypothetical protein
MGCIGRIGCLIVLVLLGIAAWLTRDRWLPRLTHHTPVTTATAPPGWEPLTDRGAERTRAALDRLSKPQGRAFETLSGSDVASYVFQTLARQMPAGTDSVRAMVVGDQVRLRASVKVGELSGIGALAHLLGDRENVEMSGTFRVVHPGLAEFQVRQVKVGAVTLPASAVPELVHRFVRGQRPAGLSDSGLPLPLPSYIGDIRVANGKITLYKNIS